METIGIIILYLSLLEYVQTHLEMVGVLTTIQTITNIYNILHNCMLQRFKAILQPQQKRD